MYDDDYYYSDERVYESDWEKDTWDAMTDGEYGDCPDGDVDYDALGF